MKPYFTYLYPLMTKQGLTIRKKFFSSERTSLKKFLGIPLNFKDELFKTIFGNYEIN